MSKKKIFIILIAPLIAYVINLKLIPFIPFLKLKLIVIIIQSFIFEAYATLVFIAFKVIPDDVMFQTSGGFVPISFPNPIVALFALLLTLYLLKIATKYIHKFIVQNDKANKNSVFKIGLIVFFLLLTVNTIQTKRCEQQVKLLPYLRNKNVGDIVYVNFDMYLTKEEKEMTLDLFGFNTIFYSSPRDDLAYIYPYNEGDITKLCVLEKTHILRGIYPRPESESMQIRDKYGL